MPQYICENAINVTKGNITKGKIYVTNRYTGIKEIKLFKIVGIHLLVS